MKKNLTKKLMLSVLTLAFAVVSLGASTFAWFTTSKNANVEKFTMNVTANAGIQIAVANAKNPTETKSNYYVGTLPASVVEKKINYGVTGVFAFTDVTTLSDKAINKNTFNGKFYDKDNKETTAGYVALQFYVKADAAGKLTVNLPWLTNETYDSIEAWAAGTEFTRPGTTTTVAANAKYKYDARSAARMFVDFSGGKVVSDPHLFEEINIEAPAQGNFYGNTLGVSDKGALQIYNTITNAATNKTVPQTETAEAYYKYTDKENFAYVANIERDVEYTLTYYIWLEGFDGECLNAIFAQVLSNSISFEFEQTSGQLHTHVFTDGKCSCGASDPDYVTPQPPVVEDDTTGE